MYLFTFLYFVVTFVVANTLSIGDNGITPHHSPYDVTVPPDNQLIYEAINQPDDVQGGSDSPEPFVEADQLGQEQAVHFSHFLNNVLMGVIIAKTEDMQVNGATENEPSGDYGQSKGLKQGILSLKLEEHNPVQFAEENKPRQDNFASAYFGKSATETEAAFPGNDGIIMRAVMSEEESNIAPSQLQNVLKRERRSVDDNAKSTPADITKLFEGIGKADKEISHLAEGGVLLNSSAILLSTSPEQLSSTMNTTLDEYHQSGADFTHSVEGGGVPRNEGTPTKYVNLTQTLSTSSLQANTSMIITTEHNSQMDSDSVPTSTSYSDPKSHRTVPRKGAETGKIVGRKGVDDINVSARPTPIDDAPLSLPSASNHSINGHLALTANATFSPIPSIDEIIESNPPLKKKPNPKPLTLTDKTSFNTTPAPQDHVSSQRDLVVPVVALILAVPLVTILGIFLYKKGSEYWSRRHYRRMDFLIDGMYND